MSISSNSIFNVLIVDFERNNSNYRKILSDIPQTKFLFTENYLEFEDLIKQKGVDAILVNIRLLIEPQPKDFNLIKKHLNDFRIPLFFFTTKSNLEINTESALNTSLVPPESLTIQSLVLSIIKHIELEKSESLGENESLANSNRTADIVNQQKAVFIRNLTYEIRTLLNNVGGPMQLIKEKIDDPELIPFFGIIDTTLNRMVEFTFKANLASDLKLGNYIVKKTSVNLEEIIRFTVLELSEFLELEKIKLTINPPQFKTDFSGDRDLLFHCFTAILDKVINLTKENGEIVIDFMEDSGNLNCKVYTNSITFPKHEILEIFDSNSTEQEIGLAFAKIVLNIHKGSYWVDLIKETGVVIGISFKIGDHE